MRSRRRLAVLTGLVLPIASIGWSMTAPAAIALGIAPVADTLTIVHDHATTVPAPGVLGNDLGILGGTTAQLVTAPSHGTVSLASNGGYTYDPDADYVGTDRFWYRPSGLITTSTPVTITITNIAPVAAPDAYTATTGTKLTVAAPGVLRNDRDADGDALAAILVDGGGNGSLSLARDGGFTFTSGGSFTGLRTFTYRAFDGIASSAVVTVTIDVRPLPATPTPAPTATPTPAPTPTPTPAPTPTPGATRTPAPTPTRTPTSLPTASILPIPVPTILPKPTASARPTPTPTPGPSGSPGSSPSPAPSSSAAGPPRDAAATPDDAGGAGPAAGGSTETADPSAPPKGSTGARSGAGRRFEIDHGGSADLGGFTDLELVGARTLIDWAVPALVLTVPGLLVILAVLAQAIGAVLWLPIARRWLGAFGLRSRRRDPEPPARG